MMSLKMVNLNPLFRTIAIVGGTGDGKSKVASLPADKMARQILSKSVGETNSTLKERTIVYSEDYADEMVIAVKLLVLNHV